MKNTLFSHVDDFCFCLQSNFRKVATRPMIKPNLNIPEWYQRIYFTFFKLIGFRR